MAFYAAWLSCLPQLIRCPHFLLTDWNCDAATSGIEILRGEALHDRFHHRRLAGPQHERSVCDAKPSHQMAFDEAWSAYHQPPLTHCRRSLRTDWNSDAVRRALETATDRRERHRRPRRLAGHQHERSACDAKPSHQMAFDEVWLSFQPPATRYRHFQ